MQIREYRPEVEEGWLRCRVLAFLHSAYYDNVLREKERYRYPAIELVAELDGTIVGLIDLECEAEPGTVCSNRPGLAAMIWHLAIHPDCRGRGIARALLEEAVARARERGIVRLEAWTRDDADVRRWYERQGFEPVDSYLHVYVDGPEELHAVIRSQVPKLYPVFTFAHYTGEEREWVRGRFRRVHECVLYELRLEESG